MRNLPVGSRNAAIGGVFLPGHFANAKCPGKKVEQWLLRGYRCQF